jgi:hypothetical protein
MESNWVPAHWTLNEVEVDLRRRCAWIHPDQAKDRKAIAVSLSEVAVLALREQI